MNSSFTQPPVWDLEPLRFCHMALHGILLADQLLVVVPEQSLSNDYVGYNSIWKVFCSSLEKGLARRC